MPQAGNSMARSHAYTKLPMRAPRFAKDDIPWNIPNLFPSALYSSESAFLSSSNLYLESGYHTFFLSSVEGCIRRTISLSTNRSLQKRDRILDGSGTPWRHVETVRASQPL